MPCEMINPHHPDCTCTLCLASRDHVCGKPAIGTHEGTVRVCEGCAVRLEREGFAVTRNEERAMPDKKPEELPPGSIRLDPAVDAAKRLVAILNDGKLTLPKEVNDDVITMAVVILRLGGYQITDKTGDKT